MLKAKGTQSTAQSAAVVKLVDQVRPVLAGQPAAVQGAVLADLLAIWLAGHQVAGDEDATRRLRLALLSKHFAAVCRLVPINEMLMSPRQ